MKRNIMTVKVRRVSCSGCRKHFEVQGDLLSVKLVRSGHGWLATCPELCCHAYGWAKTWKHALHEIGDGVCAVLSCIGAKEVVSCPGPKGEATCVHHLENPSPTHKHCYEWGRWRDAFGQYIQDVIE